MKNLPTYNTFEKSINNEKAILKTEKDIIELIKNDIEMVRILKIVRDLNLPDCWIGAGFIRNKIWDYLHGYKNKSVNNNVDIDICYFDPNNLDENTEKIIDNKLKKISPGEKWSAKNQARMHSVNSNKPYKSTLDAIKHWTETATAVAIRINSKEEIEFKALYGIDDLIKLIVRPTPYFLSSQKKMKIYKNRIEKKQWNIKWPKLKIIFN